MPLFSKRSATIGLLVVTLLIIVAVILVTAVIAAERSLPGDNLYSFKIAKEDLIGSLIFQNDKKLEYNLKRADERLKEITLLTGKILSQEFKKPQALAPKKAPLVLADTDVNFQQSPKLSFEEMLKEAETYLARIEVNSTAVRRRLENARAARDIVKTLCLNDKLSQIDVSLRSAKDRKSSLQAAVARKDNEHANHEFTILTVYRQRADQLAAEANQCIGEDSAFIGATQVVTRVDPTLVEPPLEPSEVIDNIPLDAKSEEALIKAWQNYIELIKKLPQYLSSQKNLELIKSFLASLMKHKTSINNLAPLTPPQILDDLDPAQDAIKDLNEAVLDQAEKIDDTKSVEVRRELIGKEAEILANYLDSGCDDGLIIKSVCIKGITNRNGIYVSPYNNLINDLTEERLSANPWIQNRDYIDSVIAEGTQRLIRDYKEDSYDYQDKAYKQPNWKDEQVKFASQMFNHWAAFVDIQSKDTGRLNTTNISQLIAIAKINETTAIAQISEKDPVTAAGVIMALMDRELKILTDETGQPIQVNLNDYGERLNVLQATIADPKNQTISSQIILANEELVRRGLVHGIYLTIIKDKISPEGEIKIESTIQELSNTVKDSVSIIKSEDPDLYKSKQAYYQPLSQGLQRGLMQGLSQGMQQGLQQGISQGLQQGIHQGLQQGIYQGLQQGIIQGLPQGVPQGFYNLLLEELKKPPNESWLGGDMFGGDDFSGGDDFGGSDFGAGDAFGGGDDFGGGDSFGGSDFGGGDFFGADGFYAIIIPSPTGLIQKVPQGLAPLGEEPTPTPGYTTPAPTYTTTPSSTTAPSTPSATPPPSQDPATACTQNGCTWTGSACQCP